MASGEAISFGPSLMSRARSAGSSSAAIAVSFGINDGSIRGAAFRVAADELSFLAFPTTPLRIAATASSTLRATRSFVIDSASSS